MDKLRGFRDIFPEDAEPRKKIFDVANSVSERFDFLKIEFPSVEYLDLYRLKSGDELVGQTFSFKDRGDREVALTPEATPTVVRMLTSRKDLQMPVKWYSFQRYWRYEEPQAGRSREFSQYNADIFGIDSIEADSEIIGLACTILDDVGLSGKYTMRINSREFMESLLSSLGVSDFEATYAALDKLKKSDRTAIENDLQSAGISPENTSKILEIVEKEYSSKDFPFERFSFLGENSGKLKRLVETAELASSYTQSSVIIDFSIVRGLTYYTGVVFEAYSLSGTLRSILGGGRYNRLASLMSDADIPAVGFGMGDLIIELLLKENNIFETQRKGKSVFVCYSAPEYYAGATEVVNKLRAMGIRAATSLSRKSLSSQMKQASRRDFSFAAILGEKEIDAGTLSVKNLESGIQKDIKLRSLEDIFSI